MRNSIYAQAGVDKVAEIVAKSNFFSDVLRYFGKSTVGTGNFSVLKRYLIENNIPYTHFIENRKNKQIESLNKINNNRRLKLEEIMVENSFYNRSSLKRRLIREKRMEYKCSICGMGDKWNGKKITLQLDHINGVFNDNRFENLRFLCPNCHSQEPNACRRYGTSSEPMKCSECGKNISFRTKNTLCFSCWKKSDIIHSDRLNYRKVKRPSKENLEKMILERPCSKIAKELGVSDKAIEKWCKRYGIKKPGRGYWAKIKVLQN